MSTFALRGSFYLGDHGTRDQMVEQADRLMAHLVDIERQSPVRDAAVSLDAASRTVEVELIVEADTMLAAHGLASVAVASAFQPGGQGPMVERSVELIPA